MLFHGPPVCHINISKINYSSQPLRLYHQEAILLNQTVTKPKQEVPQNDVPRTTFYKTTDWILWDEECRVVIGPYSLLTTAS